MKDRLLIVSFGTADAGGLGEIAAVEQALAARANLPWARAFSSEAVRRILHRRGVDVPSPAAALREAAAGGAQRVWVQPTHIAAGADYAAVCGAVQDAAPHFAHIAAGRPLLADERSAGELARILCEAYPSQPGEAALFLLHGTAGRTAGAALWMQRALQARGAGDVVACLRGQPGFDAAAHRLLTCGARRVRLVPLMLCAGSHARGDMAGPGPDSWASRLARAGFSVQCTLRGLGALAPVQALYARRLDALLGRAPAGEPEGSPAQILSKSHAARIADGAEFWHNIE